MMNQPISNPTPSNNTGKTTPSAKTNTPNTNSNDNKNHARSKRRTQEAEEGNLYDINVDKVMVIYNRFWINSVEKLEACGRTTVMIRNIPNKYDLPLIAQTIDKNHKGKYDFFYLPIDFSVTLWEVFEIKKSHRIVAILDMLLSTSLIPSLSKIFTWNLTARNGKNSTVKRFLLLEIWILISKRFAKSNMLEFKDIKILCNTSNILVLWTNK